ncbi:GAF and ANTAR domain-containing protein [Saccharothrix australiensis]|uniref:GAF domain-containing protein n=1 Tax=Saccharothrix australiensis TaxID=2072 RepID=A0A495W195_9PSEU|nr:GAF and ANTAR domain-containing protein [Saccharothrix australiensis]RKT55461.1 GAF domain-containing protein [Saccharothrix australiensis]
MADDDSVMALARELVEVSRLVEDDDVAGVARRFLDRLVRTVPGCDHALLTVRGDDGPEAVAASGESPRLDSLSGSGPIGEALEYREPRRIADTAEDSRWTWFAAELALEGFRSCLVLPVPTTRPFSAALTLLSRAPHRFDEDAYDVVLLLTLHAGAVFDNVRLYHDSRKLVDNLTTALHTRHVIGQAQGILMHRFSCTTGETFALLRRASQHGNTKLRDVAAAVVSGQEGGRLSDVLAEYGLTQVADPSPSLGE